MTPISEEPVKCFESRERFGPKLLEGFPKRSSNDE